MDQTTLAERLGVSKSTVSRILGGLQEPKLRLARDLARALGVSLDCLADEEGIGPAGGQLVWLSAEELAVLAIVRRLGTDAALDRLIHVPPASSGQDEGPFGGADRPDEGA